MRTKWVGFPLYELRMQNDWEKLTTVAEVDVPNFMKGEKTGETPSAHHGQFNQSLSRTYMMVRVRVCMCACVCVGVCVRVSRS